MTVVLVVAAAVVLFAAGWAVGWVVGARYVAAREFDRRYRHPYPPPVRNAGLPRWQNGRRIIE